MMNDTINRAAAIDAVTCGALSAATLYGRTDEGATALKETVRAIKALPSAQQWIPWDRKTRNSMVNTLQMFRRLAYNIHGVMDVIDDDNVRRLIEWLEGGEP